MQAAPRDQIICPEAQHEDESTGVSFDHERQKSDVEITVQQIAYNPSNTGFRKHKRPHQHQALVFRSRLAQSEPRDE